VCCSVLQCVAVYYSVLQCVNDVKITSIDTMTWRPPELYRSVLQCVAVCCSVMQCVAVCGSGMQCVAVCGSVMQCVAVCGSIMQCVAAVC